jgi:exopolysaccharide biosynthesis protein
MHGFVSLRAPRTALGVTENGDILLVVIDGHRFRDDQPAAVAMNGGATLDELRSIMQHLGARDAINLDGGGSSVMVGPDGVLSHPSDAIGERTVGETLVIVPKKAL